MADKTLSQLITNVQRSLYQVAGISVQVYSQDNIAAMIQRAFDFVFDDYDWKRFYTFEQYTLDEVTGRATIPINTVFKEFDDISKVFPFDSDLPLSKLSSERNPAKYVGTSPIQYCADPINVIRVVPITAVGDIIVTGQMRPNAFILTDIVPFNSDAIEMFACWQYSADDGANPTMTDKFQGLFETKLKQLKDNQDIEPISLSMGRNTYVPTSWTE